MKKPAALRILRSFARTIVVLTAWVLLPAVAAADILLEARLEDSAGTSPRSIRTGDLNGDSYPDLAVANHIGNDVSVLLGDGDGTFGDPVQYAVGDGPTSIAIGDFSGDGIPDLAVANSISNDISVLLGTGAGIYMAAVNYPAGEMPTSIVSGNLNDDGYLDLAVSNSTSADVSLFWGVGDGTFGTAESFPAGNDPQSVVIGDLAGDSSPDLAVGVVDGVSLLVGDGSGTFGTPEFIYVGSQTTISVATGNLDGRNSLDLAVAGRWNSHVSVLLANGDGTFQGAVNYPASANTRSIAIDDMGGNGVPDLVTANYHGKDVSVLLGNGDGTFQDAENYGLGDDDGSPVCVAIADLNQDDAPDLAVVSDGWSNNIFLLMGRGDGTLRVAVSYGKNTIGEPVSLAANDLDGDGHQDLVTAGGYLNNTSVLRGNGDGSFQDATNYDIGSRVSAVALGNMDGDQNLDLVAAGSAGVSILTGNGDGSFQAAQNVWTDSGARSVAIDDLDGDGNQDLALAHGESLLGARQGSSRDEWDGVTVLLGNGDGTFQDAQNYLVGYIAQSVVIGNLNSDMAPDLVTAGGVSVLLNNGDGTFGAPVNYGGLSWSVAIGDLDGDGYSDLAAATVIGEVTVHPGKGDGTFNTGTTHSTSYGLSSVATSDLDGDQDLDLLLVQYLEDNVLVLLGNGDATFGDGVHYGVDDRPRSVVAVDLNGDSRPDLVAGNEYDGTLSVLLNSPLTRTISASLTCIPAANTIPFDVTMDVTLVNTYAGLSRRIAGRVDMDLANGQHFTNYRGGHATIGPGGSRVVSWNQPFTGESIIGTNTISLFVQDVTHAPYNFPPHPPAGDTDTDSCTVIGNAP